MRLDRPVQCVVLLRQQRHMIEEILNKIGLSDHEAIIYGTLLRQSPAGASFIAKKCNLSRSTVYTVLNGLISKGLVGTTYKNEVKQFIAEEVSALKQILETQRKQIDDKLDGFAVLEKRLLSFNGDMQLHIPHIIFFEGQEGLKKIYMSMLRDARKDAIMYILRDEYVWKPEWKFVFEKEWRNRVDRIKQEKNITTRLLINDSKVERDKRKYYASRSDVTYRFLPAKQSVDEFVIYILEDVISILSMEKNNLIGIKITNQHLADNFRKLFDAFWYKKS